MERNQKTGEKIRMLQQKQILIVEDNELNRAMLHEILSSQYRLLEAANGQEALDILHEYSDDIALILLDVIMPVMDGYTFLNSIKDDTTLSLIPVIVMTQGDSEADEVSALVHGATDFVPKPYRPQVILHRVASIIKLRETAALVNQFKYDRLTGLYSKEFFYQTAREQLNNNPDTEYTIVCSNIENFKLYNDTFGREAGDILLKHVAEGVRSMIGEAGICGRYGADRFMFMQERNQESKDRLQFISNEPGCHSKENSMKSLSTKWGIYEITDRSVPVEQMCDRALLAADSIKGQYNHHIAVYDDTLRSKLLKEKAITDSMETALSENQFTVYFQPKYSLSDSCIVGAEALVRWIHPEWGFISPGDFIPLFEKNGFIPRLDQYVWEHVCSYLQEWRRKGYPSLAVSVNMSRSDIYQSKLVDTLLDITRRYGVEPAQLHLEITESAYTENPDKLISTVKELRRLGFIIEMDDFGSGYSSLNMFSRMELDILKLDMTFIRNEMSKPAEQSIISDIISMAHRMHLNVVAEGVETREQVKRLRAVGCDYVQGYYFAKPMPAEEFDEMLKHLNPDKAVTAQRTPTSYPGVQSLLVVDDDARYRKSVHDTFDGRYHVLDAADTCSALDCIRKDNGDSISAIILSMMLPENDISDFLKALRQDPALWQIPVLSTIPNGEMADELPLALETDDFLCKSHPVFDLRRRVEHLMDIVAFRRRESILQDQACRDYLTGLLNRRGLHAATAALRKEDKPLAVFIFDLDNLKNVNDTYGHDMGDKIIRTFADILRRNSRNGDILCRYGGDEFILILKCIRDTDAVIKKGETICRAFRECFADEHINAACSGGIALCGADDKSCVALYERADRALYYAKSNNKGGCSIWSESMESSQAF